MATLSDLKEMKEALDAGLVSQAEFDGVKRDYLRAKEEALEANKEFQKMELQIQKRELLAKEAFQKRKAEEELRTYALESIVKHGSSIIMSEEQKADLVCAYVRAKKKALEAKEEAFEFQMKELRAKEEALEANKEFQKMELHAQKEALQANKEFQRRELIAKEAVQQANIERLKMDLRAKEEAFEASKEFQEFQKKEIRAKEEALEFQKRELIAKEAFQKRKADAELRAYALESIVKHGFSIMSEEQKIDLVRDYVRMSGLDRSAEKDAPASKRQRVSAEKRNASPPHPPTPPAPAAAVPPPADVAAPVVANQATAPAPPRLLLVGRFRSMSDLVKEKEQKADLVRDYVKVSGLDSGAKKDFVRTQSRSKRQRIQDEKGDEASPPQPATPLALPPPADAPAPAEEDEYSIYSDDDEDLAELAHGLLVVKATEGDSDSDELQAAKQTKSKQWTEDDDAALVAALRAGQAAWAIRIPGRGKRAAENRLRNARENGSGGPALREYLEETCPEYVYRGPSEKTSTWSVDEDHTFIQAHREGKTLHEIAAMLPRRTYNAVKGRWGLAKNGKTGTAALRAYVAECCKDE